MRQHFGKKIGQSRYELKLAVFFSFFLHAAVIALALFLYVAMTPKMKIPPFYQVKLVGLPAESHPAPVQEAAPPARKEEAPPAPPAEPKVKKAEAKPAKVAPAKGDIPEFTRQKPKPEKPETARTERAAAPPAPAVPPSSAKPGGKAEGGVAVSAGPEDFKFPYYLVNIRNIIESNWNPPPVAKGAKAKVEFTILRSGRVFGDVRLQESSGNDIFDLAARRAILLSSPFPRMPDDFYRDRAVFTVDLTE
ncbi:MAG: energy transducer TonB [Betaproteobacteria bacterium]